MNTFIRLYEGLEPFIMSILLVIFLIFVNKYFNWKIGKK
ncbi:hypothetical protein AC7_1095 [Clostridium perfringens NCTC 8239]|nr:hypothetical protein AC7_1095 [Clostridium perfringens NCTC 8239]